MARQERGYPARLAEFRNPVTAKMTSTVCSSLMLALCLFACETSTSRWSPVSPHTGEFTLLYPAGVLDAAVDSTGVRLHRRVNGPARKPFCDFKGTEEPTSHIVDFDYRFTFHEVPDTAVFTRGGHPWRVGRVSVGGHGGVEDRIGTGGCGLRVITLFLDAHHVLDVRGMRLTELRALESKGVLSETEAFRAGEVDSLLNRIVGTLELPS